MQYRRLGRTDLEASVLGFGCSRIAASQGADRREVEATLLEAIARGINLYDTANCHGAGEAELLLGRVLRAHRSEVILCSKVGVKHWSSVLFERGLDPLRFALRGWMHRRRQGSGGQAGAGGRPRGERAFTPRFLELGVAGSLRRLGTDHLDVLYLHGPPAGVLADPAVFAKLDDLVRRGWIRWYGVSFTTATTTAGILATIERWPGIAVVQALIHPLSTIDLTSAAPAARERGVAIIARQALDKGALLTHGDLAAIGGAGCTRAQTLIRFVAQRDGVAAVLVGMRSRAHLRENLAAFDAPALSEDEMRRLCSASVVR